MSKDPRPFVSHTLRALKPPICDIPPHVNPCASNPIHPYPPVQTSHHEMFLSAELQGISFGAREPFARAVELPLSGRTALRGSDKISRTRIVVAILFKTPKLVVLGKIVLLNGRDAPCYRKVLQNLVQKAYKSVDICSKGEHHPMWGGHGLMTAAEVRYI